MFAHGVVIHVLATDPPPQGYVLVAEYEEKLDKNKDAPKDDKEKDETRIRVRVYRRR